MRHQAPPRWLESVAGDAGIVVWMAAPDLSRFLYVSPGLSQIWGRPTEPLYEDARPFFEAILAEDRAGMLEADLGPAPSAWAGPSTWEFRIRRPDGELRWVRHHGGPVPDGGDTQPAHAGILRDITFEKRVLDEHRRAEEELAAVFRALPDLAFVVDHEGRYIRVASGDPEQLYRPGPELTGRTFHDVLPAELADWFLHMVERTLEEDSLVHFRYPLEIGRRTEWFDAILVPMGSDQVLWVARTITEIIELEQKLAHSSKLDALGQLAGGIAHDFNNAITVIQGTTSLLAERIQDPELLRDLGDIRRASDRASSLTRQLLAFGRQQVLQPDRVAVTDIVEPMGRMLSRIIGENIELRIVTTGAPGAVLIDPGQLEQVVANLVVNASHAIPAEGWIRLEVSDVELEPEHELVRNGALDPGPHVCLTVADNGTGMSPEVASRAFDPFFTTKASGEGTGLGLSMVYGTVRQSGGSVEIETAPGEGTTVRILFPAASPAQRGSEPRRAPEREEAAAGAERAATILVVEDEPPVRQVIRRFLESAGHRVYEAANGVDALEKVRVASDIDLVLTDLVMPRMGGTELIRHLRETRPDLPVILISGYTGKHLSAGDTLDVQAFLSKPFKRNELLQAVRSTLEGEAGRRRDARGAGDE